MLANINVLLGRKYVAASNNIAEFSKLGAGAIGIEWYWEPSAKDCAECDEWVINILESVNGTVVQCASLFAPTKAVERHIVDSWKEETRGELEKRL